MSPKATPHHKQQLMHKSATQYVPNLLEVALTLITNNYVLPAFAVKLAIRMPSFQHLTTPLASLARVQCNALKHEIQRPATLLGCFLSSTLLARPHHAFVTVIIYSSNSPVASFTTKLQQVIQSGAFRTCRPPASASMLLTTTTSSPQQPHHPTALTSSL